MQQLLPDLDKSKGSDHCVVEVGVTAPGVVLAQLKCLPTVRKTWRQRRQTIIIFGKTKRVVTAACFTNLHLSLFFCFVFLLGHRYSVHIYYSFNSFKIQQGSTTLKRECQDWLEVKGRRVLCGGKIRDLQSNSTPCLLPEVKCHGFLMQEVGFICHLWNAFLSVLFFDDFFFLIQCCLFFCEFSLRKDLWP